LLLALCTARHRSDGRFFCSGFGARVGEGIALRRLPRYTPRASGYQAPCSESGSGPAVSGLRANAACARHPRLSTIRPTASSSQRVRAVLARPVLAQRRMGARYAASWRAAES
jgi:hypothetical protein